ncbi:MAG TPA: protein kinase [Gaiellaceae bacterium]|nr:protein kinase [Gaiellaceae bacterium]
MDIASDPRIGTELAGYRIEEPVGRGGMSVVYRARDLRLDRPVALKLLTSELAGDERFRTRFLRESRLAAAIEHPNIIPVYEAGEADGVLYLAMRYVDGVDLARLLGPGQPLEPERALAILARVASALDAAHLRGLVHRDVKPSNVLIGGPASDETYLCDFGLSKRVSSLSGLTAVGQLMGTVDYMAPEQIEGRGLDARADVYALGAVLFECLAGTPPYRRESEVAVLWAHMQEPLPALTELRPELPSGLDAILARALAKDPGERHASAGELVDAVRGELGLGEADQREPDRPRSASRSLEEHCEAVAKAMLAGRLVPLLGSGVNVCGRPEGAIWEPTERRWLPGGFDLATHLAEAFEYPPGDIRELPRVSQYVAIMRGLGPLYDELHEVLDADYLPGPVHRFLAGLPPVLRAAGARHQLIVTTNYDAALEQAFREAGEELDVVSYIGAGRNRGKFRHVAPDGSSQVIDVPNTYAAELSLDERTIILKLHGQVDRDPEREWESFVVTEDDYIDYLGHTDLSSLVPVGLAARLRRSHFLFLGCGMRDWNFRLILNRIWREQKLSYRSWAVQPAPTAVEREFWRHRDVDVVDLPLPEYVATLERHVGTARPRAAG